MVPTGRAAPEGDDFLHRQKLLCDRDEAEALAREVHELLAAGRQEELHELLDGYYPADLADVMDFLSDQEKSALFHLLDTDDAAEVLDEVDDPTEQHLIRTEEPERLAAILENLAPDEGADVVGGMEPDQAAEVLGLMEAEDAEEIRELLRYPRDSAGGIMSTAFVSVPETATQADALKLFRESVDAEEIFYIYVVDASGALKGQLDLRRLVTAAPETVIGDITTPNVLHVHPEADQEQVANIFARYDLTAIPVAEEGTLKLLGVITSDDIIDVIQEESDEDAMHSVGSDAGELEQRHPAQVALMRMPWIMATLFIELIAGFVIKVFDGTLAQFLLLASFMPIISAISGNTGLQSATIIVRGLSTGHVRLSDWRRALARQVTTTLILGAACGAVLGLIAAVWSGKWAFGMVVAIGMFVSVNIAGVVGTIVPLISKRLGYDPALTAGPFETAFQDVVGISIFLGLATSLMHWLK